MADNEENPSAPLEGETSGQEGQASETGHANEQGPIDEVTAEPEEARSPETAAPPGQAREPRPSRAEIVPFTRQVCPHLGLHQDRTVIAIAPTAAHACYARKRPIRPDVAHQRTFCLGGRFPFCQYYPRPAEEKIKDIYVLQAELENNRSGRLLWTALALVAGIVLALAALYGLGLLPNIATLLPARPTPSESPTIVAAVAAPAADTATPTPPSTPIAQVAAAVTPQAPSPEAAVLPRPDSPSVTQLGTPVPPAAGSQFLELRPRQVDVAWWPSGEARQRYIGDSFLYAGVLDQSAYVSAIRFDIRRVARGAPIEGGVLHLTGLRDNRHDRSSDISWLVQLLAEEALPELPSADFETVFGAPASITLSPVLAASDVAAGVANQWTLDANARDWLYQQVLGGATSVIARIAPFTGSGETLFAWDSGHGTESGGTGPLLLLEVGPPPPTPPPTATRAVVVATFTPEPENVLTVVARMSTATTEAAGQNTLTPTPTLVTVVTPTPIPANLATVQAAALAEGLPPVVQHTPVPANGATATANAAYATAIALTTGTFTPVPTGYVTPALIFPSPPAENVATAAARSLTATAVAIAGEPAPTRPFNAVEAIYVYATATPANMETAVAQIEERNLIAASTGTPTPTPWNLRVITRVPEPTATDIPLVVPANRLTPTPTPTPTRTLTTGDLTQFSGKILFLSDRSGRAETWVMEPSTGEVLAVVTDPRIHEQARELYLAFSPSRLERAVVRPGSSGELQIFVENYEYDTVRQLTDLANNQGVINYDPAWSPQGNRIAFVSNITFGDEIYTIGVDGKGLERLTNNSWEWDKHPTWSPDGSEIAFFSNRQTGRRQIWIMSADGTDQRNLSPSDYSDWDPVWIP